MRSWLVQAQRCIGARRSSLLRMLPRGAQMRDISTPGDLKRDSFVMAARVARVLSMLEENHGEATVGSPPHADASAAFPFAGS